MNSSTTAVIIEKSPEASYALHEVPEVRHHQTDSGVHFNDEAQQGVAHSPLVAKMSFRSHAIAAMSNISRIHQRLLLPRGDKFVLLHEHNGILAKIDADSTQQEPSAPSSSTSESHLEGQNQKPRILAALAETSEFMDPLQSIKSSNQCDKQTVLRILQSGFKSWISDVLECTERRDLHLLIYHTGLSSSDVETTINQTVPQGCTFSDATNSADETANLVGYLVVDFISLVEDGYNAEVENVSEYMMLLADGRKVLLSQRWHVVQAREVSHFSTTMFTSRHGILRYKLQTPSFPCQDELLTEPHSSFLSLRRVAWPADDSYPLSPSRFDVVFPDRAQKLRREFDVSNIGERLIDAFDALDIPCIGVRRAAFLKTDSTFRELVAENEEAIPTVDEHGNLEKLLVYHIGGQLCLHDVEKLSEKRYISLPQHMADSQRSETTTHMPQEFARKCAYYAAQDDLKDVRVSAFVRLVFANALGTSNKTSGRSSVRTLSGEPQENLFQLQLGQCYRRFGYVSSGVSVGLSNKNENSLCKPPTGPIEPNFSIRDRGFHSVVDPPLLVEYESRKENKVSTKGSITAAIKPNFECGITHVSVVDYFQEIGVVTVPTTGRMELLTRWFPVHHSEDLLWGLPQGESQGISTRSLQALYQDGDHTQYMRESSEERQSSTRRTRGGRVVKRTGTIDSSSFSAVDEGDLLERRNALIANFQAEAATLFDYLVKSKLSTEEQNELLTKVEDIHDRYLYPQLPPMNSNNQENFQNDLFQGIDRKTANMAGWSMSDLTGSAIIGNDLAPTATHLWWAFVKSCSSFQYHSPGHKQVVEQLEKIGSDYYSGSTNGQPTVLRAAGGPLVKPSPWIGGDGSGRDIALHLTKTETKPARKR
eukprot:gb/GECG01004027.1/.p1 GENE.gb/GECG01004027.1/~~gb/GECG01004027.1/.p1  ORF type:complete len:878 (+),score=99.01 gb/GECG01004027.1/:1-2634(+)